MDWIEEHPKASTYIIGGLILIALLGGGLMYSIGTVEPIEYALKYN